MRDDQIRQEHLDTAIIGDQITLEDILTARDERCAGQRRLLEQHRSPLLSFTLNIPGSVKVFPLTIGTFDEGLGLIRRRCRAEGIPMTSVEMTRQKTGYEALIAAAGDALQLKRLMTDIEEHHPLGRLFDIDVLRPDGTKVSRSQIGYPERRCLLCGEAAAVCARSRAHRTEEVLERACTIMRDHLIEEHADSCADLAVKALLYEVTVTPKPGLVDRTNSGAHTDMDIFSFIDSAVSLRSYFGELTRIGSRHSDERPSELFERIRPIGRSAEIDMADATGGVNTHKGLIFSLGILCCAAGRLHMRPEGYSRVNLAQSCAAMTAHLMEDFIAADSSTAGKRCFNRYGLTGIRGEASKGFPTAFTTALPELEHHLRAGQSCNDACVRTLITIMASAEDTNIVSRSSYDRMVETQREMRTLAASELFTDPDLIREIERLDRSYIDENISPGGAADILAQTLFLHFYESYLTKKHSGS